MLPSLGTSTHPENRRITPKYTHLANRFVIMVLFILYCLIKSEDVRIGCEYMDDTVG